MYDYDEDYSERFFDPGGTSALHPGVREYPCPSCDQPDCLTYQDVQSGYQCDSCADALEFGW